jgi:hypothetical protein
MTEYRWQLLIWFLFMGVGSFTAFLYYVCHVSPSYLVPILVVSLIGYRIALHCIADV